MLVKHYRIILFLLFLMPFASCIFSTSFCLFPSLVVQFHLSFFILPFCLHFTTEHDSDCCSHIFNLSFILKQFAFVLFNSIIQKQTTLKCLFFISVYLSLIIIDIFLTEFIIFTVTFSLLPFWCSAQLDHSMLIHPKVCLTMGYNYWL